MARQTRSTRDHQHLVVVADADRARCEAVRARLEAVPAHAARDRVGPTRRYRILTAHDCGEALRMVTPEVSALVCDLDTARRDGVEIIGRLRSARPDLAILCYTAAPRAEAIAAMMAGADHCVEYDDGDSIVHALDLAIDRRWLSQLVERSVADLEEARRRLDRLGPGTSVFLPGLRPPLAANAVIPFHEAVRRYLAACARLFEGNPKGLADRLGMSYFALRRLLKRYDVVFPGRTLGRRSRRGARKQRSLDWTATDRDVTSPPASGTRHVRVAGSARRVRQLSDSAGAEIMAALADKFAVNLKNERIRRKLSQEGLAAKAGLSVSYISMLERGQRTPPLDTLESLAKALSVSATSLLS